MLSVDLMRSVMDRHTINTKSTNKSDERQSEESLPGIFQQISKTTLESLEDATMSTDYPPKKRQTSYQETTEGCGHEAPERDEEKSSDISRAEKKRRREQKRRNDATKGFDDLLNVLQRIDPQVLSEGESRKRQTSKSEDMDVGITRVELIARTVEVLTRVHEENEERKLIIGRFLRKEIFSSSEEERIRKENDPPDTEQVKTSEAKPLAFAPIEGGTPSIQGPAIATVPVSSSREHPFLRHHHPFSPSHHSTALASSSNPATFAVPAHYPQGATYLTHPTVAHPTNHFGYHPTSFHASAYSPPTPQQHHSPPIHYHHNFHHAFHPTAPSIGGPTTLAHNAAYYHVPPHPYGIPPGHHILAPSHPTPTGMIHTPSTISHYQEEKTPSPTTAATPVTNVPT